eukprot:15366372-Ditylum_brightwellii.AAC.1
MGEIRKRHTKQEEYARGIPNRRHMQEAYARGIRKRHTQEEDTRGRHKRKTQWRISQKHQKEMSRKRHIPSNRYVRTPTAATTIQHTASPPRDLHPLTCNPCETKPPEELRSMTAEKTTINYTKCIVKYNQFPSTHSSIP